MRWLVCVAVWCALAQAVPPRLDQRNPARLSLSLQYPESLQLRGVWFEQTCWFSGPWWSSVLVLDTACTFPLPHCGPPVAELGFTLESTGRIGETLWHMSWDDTVFTAVRAEGGLWLQAGLEVAVLELVPNQTLTTFTLAWTNTTVSVSHSYDTLGVVTLPWTLRGSRVKCLLGPVNTALHSVVYPQLNITLEQWGLLTYVPNQRVCINKAVPGQAPSTLARWSVTSTQDITLHLDWTDWIRCREQSLTEPVRWSQISGSFRLLAQDGVTLDCWAYQFHDRVAALSPCSSKPQR